MAKKGGAAASAVPAPAGIGEIVRMLDEEGKLLVKKPPLPDERVVELYRHMVRARRFDARMMKLQRQGRMGTFAPCFGQEAAQVGSIAACTPQDWFVPSFRETASALYRGATMRGILLHAMGLEEGAMVPSGAWALAAPKFMLHWPRPGWLNNQLPAIAAGGAVGCGVAVLVADSVFDPVKLQPEHRPSASSATLSADTRDTGRVSLMPCVYFIVGMTNSAPSLVPDGQRAVTVLVLV